MDPVAVASLITALAALGGVVVERLRSKGEPEERRATTIAKQQETISTLLSDLADLSARVGKLEQELTTERINHAAALGELEALRKEVKTLRAANSAYLAQIKELQKRIATLEAELAAARSA